MFHRLILLFIAVSLGLGGCSQAAPGQKPAAITVMVAASLTEPFKEIGQLFEEQHPGARVEFNFAGSQQLAQQLAEGAPADVFASANQRQMENVVSAGRVEAGSQRAFVTNRLVVVLPAGNPGEIFGLAGLAKDGIDLILAAEDVPAGEYSLEFLTRAAEDGRFGPQFKQAVLANVVSYEDSVRSVLTKVSLGEADAGIVYSSDAAGAAGEAIQQIDIPDELNVAASYPIAAIKDSRYPGLAGAFVDLIFSEPGQQIFRKYGFRPVPE